MRLETGVIQEGNDWPGVFIRGDDAFGAGVQLLHALERLGPEAETDTINLVILRNSLKYLANLLDSCNTRNNPQPQRVTLVKPESEGAAELLATLINLLETPGKNREIKEVMERGRLLLKKTKTAGE